jgi:Uma2 family endonuclease
MPAMTLIPQHQHRHSLSEYLSFEFGAAEKHEFYDGQIFAMAGGLERHSLLATNTLAALHLRLKGSPCRVYESNLRVSVASTGLYTYPDATVVCGGTQIDPKDPHKRTVSNPAMAVEVLSPSTEENDRGFKAMNYRQLPTLRHYMLISQNEYAVELISRQPDGSWAAPHKFEGADAEVPLDAFKFSLPLSEIYDGADFRSPEVPNAFALPPRYDSVFGCEFCSHFNCQEEMNVRFDRWSIDPVLCHELPPVQMDCYPAGGGGDRVWRLQADGR